MQRKRLVSLGMAGVSFFSLLSMAVPNGSIKKQDIGPVIKPPAVEFSKPEDTPVVIRAPKIVAQGYLEKGSTYCLSSHEEYLLEKLAMAEAEGEDTEGKALVILVVMNRTGDSRFPDTVEDVIYEDRQFSPVASGKFDEAEPDGDCRAALDMVLGGWDGSRGALYFESKSKSTWHRDNLEKLFVHGKHTFYTERDG